MATPISSATNSPLSSFTPALNPPPGVTPNPENPQSLAHLSTLTIGICIPTLTIFLLLRIYVRVMIRRTWILEDWIVLISWVGTMAYCGIMRTTMAHHGGKHGWDITKAQAREGAYWFHIGAVVYGVSIGFVKVSVLSLYRRVFSPHHRNAFDYTIIFIMVMVIGFYGSTSFVKIFQCTPRQRNWNKSIPGKCLDIQVILNASGAFNTVSDYVILLLPVRAVWLMQMTRRKKALVIFVFTFGLCAPIFATIGFVVRLQNTENKDTTWKQPEILLWGAAELTSGLLCVCFPELGVLLPSQHAKLRKSSGGQRRSTADPYGRKHSKDPYKVTSITDTALVAEEGDYIELEENAGHDVQIRRARSGERMKTPKVGQIMLNHEVKIERHEAF